MTIVATAVPGGSTAVSNKRAKVWDLVFSSTYTTGGETVTAATLGLKKIEQIIPNGNLALSTDLATANPVGFKVASTGLSVIVVQFEGSSANTALAEKSNSEAYATGSNIRVTVIGTGTP